MGEQSTIVIVDFWQKSWTKMKMSYKIIGLIIKEMRQKMNLNYVHISEVVEF